MRRLAERTLRYDFTVWFWGDAIAVDGLIEAAEQHSEPRAVDFCAHYLTRWAAAPPGWTDYLTPGSALLALDRQRPALGLAAAAARLARWYNEAVPAGAGGVHYFRPDLPQFRTTVLVDSMYHVPSFFARLAAATGDLAHHDTALAIWNSHADVLTSPRGPLLFHNFDVGSGRYRGYGWGRGNGWALLGLADILDVLPRGHPGRADAERRFTDLAHAVLELQDPTGFWRTLLHEPEAYLESSTVGFFGAAFTKGVRLGLLDAPFARAAERAWDGLLARIDDEGGLFGVSGVTWASTAATEDLALYRAMPTEVNVWGQGCALRFAAERLRAGSDRALD
jgi:unsaturated rhamnogalacturonyl hydrolase